jgi:hypothetical protein
MIELYKQMLETAISFNALLQGEEEFNMISRDTSARILAVIYIQSGDERIVLSPKLKADCDYIQKHYHIEGGDIPDAEIVEAIQHYTKELENHIKQYNDFPQWAYDLFKERYNFKLYKP